METSPAAADTTDFAAALAAHRPYLVAYARRRVRDAALVEDVVQDTLLAAWQGAAAFEARAALRTWLTGILQRRLADTLRSARRDPVCTGADGPADADGEDDTPAGAEAIDWIDPARRLADRQFVAALEDCLGRLPAPAARLFALRAIDGLDNAQAAAALGLDPRRAPDLLHRTVGRVRSALERAGHGALPLAA